MHDHLSYTGLTHSDCAAWNPVCHALSIILSTSELRAPPIINLSAMQDIENTTGSWDLYGVDEKKRYPALQETFFAQAAEATSRREALNAFVALGE